jgi:hypothetical protein
MVMRHDGGVFRNPALAERLGEIRQPLAQKERARIFTPTTTRLLPP